MIVPNTWTILLSFSHGDIMSSIMRNNENAIAAERRGMHVPYDVAVKAAAHPIGRGLLIKNAGYAKQWRGHDTARDGIDEYILIYCIDGKGFFEFGGTRHLISADTALVCFPAYPHWYGADEKDPWTIYWAHFTGRDASELCALSSLTIDTPVGHTGMRASMIGTFNELLSSFDEGASVARAIYAATCLRKIFTTIAIAPKASRADITDVIAHMKAHLDTDVTLAELSSLAGLSKYHFLRRFRSKTGYAPLDFFQRLRVERACELLTASRGKIAEIAREVGYEDPYYFSRVFSRVMGVSPRDYRRRAG